MASNDSQRNAKQEFFAKTKGTKSSNPQVGILWIFVIILAIGVASWFYFEKFLTSKEFSDTLGNVLEKKMGASEVDIKSLRWSSSRLTSPHIAIKPRKKGYFTKLGLSNISLFLRKSQVLKNIWILKDVRISRLNCSLNNSSEGIEPLEDLKNEIIKCPGIIPIKIPLKEAAIQQIDIAKCNLGWGEGTSFEGGIKNTKVNITTVDNAYQAKLEKGIFYHDWLKNIQIEKAKILIDKKIVKIINAELIMGEDTEKVNTTIHGTIDVSKGKWHLDLTLKLKNVFLNSIINPTTNTRSGREEILDFNKHFYGSVNGSIKIKGDLLNDVKDSMTVLANLNGNINLRIKNFQFFDRLGSMFPRGSFDRIAPTQSSIEFIKKDKQISVTKLNIISPKILQANGILNYDINRQFLKGNIALNFHNEPLDHEDDQLAAKIFKIHPELKNTYYYNLIFNEYLTELTVEESKKITEIYRKHDRKYSEK